MTRTLSDYEKKHPIGRIRRPDPRDRAYAFFTPKGQPAPPAAAAALADTVAIASVKRGYRYHVRGETLDQLPTPRCTLFCMAQLVQTGPVAQKLVGRNLDILLGRITPEILTLAGWPATHPSTPTTLDRLLTLGYDYAQRVDEWQGEAYEGTSGRAAAQFFRALGLWNSFWWTNSAEEDVDYLLRYGPLGAGSDWFTGMDKPDKNGYLRPEGTWRGGHEWTIDGVKLDKPGRPDLDGDLRMHQSWGKKTAGAPYEVAKIRLSDWRYLRTQGADSLAVATEMRIIP